jgi:hypothetical protein
VCILLHVGHPQLELHPSATYASFSRSCQAGINNWRAQEPYDSVPHDQRTSQTLCEKYNALDHPTRGLLLRSLQDPEHRPSHLGYHLQRIESLGTHARTAAHCLDSGARPCKGGALRDLGHSTRYLLFIRARCKPS